MIVGKKRAESNWNEKAVKSFICGEMCTPDHEVCFDINGLRGRYTLCIEASTQETSTFSVVYMNGIEIGSFAVPYTGNIDKFGRTEPITVKEDCFLPEDIEKQKEILEKYDKPTRLLEKTYVFEIPVILTEDSNQIRITIMPVCLNGRVKTYISDAMYIESAYLQKGIRVPNSFFSRKRPGKSLVDVWGWMSNMSFEHPGDRVTPFQEQVLRGICESFPWGANNFELQPINADGIALDLSKEEPWDGSEIYRMSHSQIWTSEKVREIIHIAKEHGMLAEFFIFGLEGAVFLRGEMNYQQKVNLFEKIVKNFSNCLETEDFNALVDGIATEAWFPIDGPSYMNGAWKWNPGFVHLISYNDGAQYDVHNAGYTPGTHAYGAHWIGPDLQHTGYDHSYPSIPYPKSFYEHEDGTVYTYMQACGQSCHPRKKFHRCIDFPYGICNRTASPDWIVAQTHNFGLRNLWDQNDHLAMAFCWEADEQTMAPPEARRYVYASSQDPVRLAACYRLEDTGAGGEIELKRVTRRVRPWDNARLRARSKYPATSIVNGNRFLQLISFPDRDDTLLHCDCSESGTFYNNGAVAEVAFPFIVTRFHDNRFLEKEIKIIESAGPVAVLEENCRMGSGYIQFSQKTRYRIFSEVPAVFTQIRRQIEPGQQGKIDTVIALTAYDQHEITGNTVVLKDTSNVLPEAVLSIDGSFDSISYVQKQGVIVTSTLLGTHCVNAAVFLKMGDYKDADTADILCVIDALRADRTCAETAAVTNETKLPMPVVARIENATQAPCFVKENGIWQHRGVTLSEEHIGEAYVRLFLKPGETGEIRPYGYLDGIRAGRGCQNVIGFSDIHAQAQTLTAKVFIDANNPMLQAPLIECERPIANVRVNGEDYSYFSGKHIYLGQSMQEIDIEITFGECDHPTITMTYAEVIKCVYNRNSNKLLITVKHQPWVRQWETPYNAVIRLANGEKRLVQLTLGDNEIDC